MATASAGAASSKALSKKYLLTLVNPHRSVRIFYLNLEDDRTV